MVGREEHDGDSAGEGAPKKVREPAKSFRDLVVWQKAHEFVLGVYRLTAGFPRDERYGLTSQLRRAAVSIPANIAEGFRKRTGPDKARFLSVAQGSAEECQYYLILCGDLQYADATPLVGQLDEASRLLTRYSEAILRGGPQGSAVARRAQC